MLVCGMRSVASRCRDLADYEGEMILGWGMRLFFCVETVMLVALCEMTAVGKKEGRRDRVENGGWRGRVQRYKDKTFEVIRLAVQNRHHYSTAPFTHRPSRNKTSIPLLVASLSHHGDYLHASIRLQLIPRFQLTGSRASMGPGTESQGIYDVSKAFKWRLI